MNFSKIVKQALLKFKPFFLARRGVHVYVYDSGIEVEFFMKKKFSRMYDLVKFEELTSKMASTIISVFNKKGINLLCNSIGSSDMQFCFYNNDIMKMKVADIKLGMNLVYGQSAAKVLKIRENGNSMSINFYCKGIKYPFCVPMGSKVEVRIGDFQ